jgi:hypothetical protein
MLKYQSKTSFFLILPLEALLNGGIKHIKYSTYISLQIVLLTHTLQAFKVGMRVWDIELEQLQVEEMEGRIWYKTICSSREGVENTLYIVVESHIGKRWKVLREERV